MDLPESISIHIIKKTPQGMYFDLDEFKQAIKDLPVGIGIIIPKHEIVLHVQPLKKWLALCNPMECVSLTIFPKRIGIQNGRSYAQFISNFYYQKSGTIRPTRMKNWVRLDIL